MPKAHHDHSPRSSRSESIDTRTPGTKILFPVRRAGRRQTRRRPSFIQSFAAVESRLLQAPAASLQGRKGALHQHRIVYAENPLCRPVTRRLTRSTPPKSWVYSSTPEQASSEPNPTAHPPTPAHSPRTRSCPVLVPVFGQVAAKRHRRDFKAASRC